MSDSNRLHDAGGGDRDPELAPAVPPPGQRPVRAQPAPVQAAAAATSSAPSSAEYIVRGLRSRKHVLVAVMALSS